jgi:DNA-binding beta-propeller fold protein YncE
LWVADGVRNRLQVFDASIYPPVPRATVELAAQPRWIAFSTDGRFVYASTGDVVGAATKKIVGVLEGPAGARVNSGNFLEIDFLDGRPVREARRFE